ncbi:MAG: hypothetical protein JXR96_15455 [Deltaproteobacteria bacterium]|nr:hypothetical protein [Deltaproteobacteria bacterium]
MREAILLALLAASLLLGGCKSGPRAGECPESMGLRCMTRKICSYDSRRGCELCQCESAWLTEPYKQGEATDEDVAPPGR